jgi:hypothetical protein
MNPGPENPRRDKAFGAEEFKYSAIWKASLMPANVNGTAAIWRG